MTFLNEESDQTCKRNAFAALVSISHDKALEFLSSVFDGIPNADELLQLGELEFIRRDAVTNPQNKVSLTIRLFHTVQLSDGLDSLFAPHFRSPGGQYKHRSL